MHFAEVSPESCQKSVAHLSVEERNCIMTLNVDYFHEVRRRPMSLQEVIYECGFQLIQEPTRVLLVDNRTRNKRQATAPEVNLWADVCQRLLKNNKRS